MISKTTKEMLLKYLSAFLGNMLKLISTIGIILDVFISWGKFHSVGWAILH